MALILQWSLKKMIIMICDILLNKFDCCIAIEGNRGLGKSTLAYHITKGVAKEMKRRGVEGYNFSAKKCLLYQRKEVISFFHKWNMSGIADEMINVTFNRDFYDEDQKDLIKMINMNRDHCNLFIACVPQFQNLDNQVKNLMKIRLTVVRRGMVIVQTPNRTIYAKDRWDQAVNEKIEREWLKKGIQRPQYSRLTTFRGLLRFPPLTEKQEMIYQEVKDTKRNVVAREQMGIEDEVDDQDPVLIATELIKQGKIRSGVYLDGMASASGKKPDTFKKAISNELRKQGKDHRLRSYYWEAKTKKDLEDTQEERKISKIINSIRDKDNLSNN